MTATKSAEEFIEDLRMECVEKVLFRDLVFEPLYRRASEKQQILMMGRLDEAREAERLLGALAVARRHLSLPAEPQHDPTPPRRSPRG